MDILGWCGDFLFVLLVGVALSEVSRELCNVASKDPWMDRGRSADNPIRFTVYFFGLVIGYERFVALSISEIARRLGVYTRTENTRIAHFVTGFHT